MNPLSRPAARLADAALEATVVGSFTSLGYRARSHLFDFPGVDRSLPDAGGRRFVVTGGTSGLGRATAHALAGLGADVVITGRSRRRARDVADQINTAVGGARVTGMALDLADFSSVDAFADAVAATARLDGLVNNAGALTHDFHRTDDGHELTYQTHVLAPFRLTERLLPLLRATPGAAVVTVSSGGMYLQSLDAAEPESGEDSYDGVRAYAMAKRAQVLLNEEWAQRHPDGPAFHAMHPGWADTPGVVDALPGFHRLVGPWLRTPAQGADTAVWLAAGGAAGSPSGQFWLDRRTRRINRLPWTGHAPAQRAELFDRVRATSAPLPLIR
jgi:NAD(P)-dependent dehydrogenase (short-subunit alcohol dehydrogenase family)